MEKPNLTLIRKINEPDGKTETLYENLGRFGILETESAYIKFLRFLKILIRKL